MTRRGRLIEAQISTKLFILLELQKTITAFKFTVNTKDNNIEHDQKLIYLQVMSKIAHLILMLTENSIQ